MRGAHIAPRHCGAAILTDCYVYLRFSTPRQERGSSKDRQLQDCRDFIARMGWNEVGLIEDLGRSAWKGVHLKSGNLGKFAQRIVDGDVAPAILVVENLDRLSRQKPRVTQRWMEDICDRGWKIASVKGGKVYDAQSLEDNIMDILDVLYQGKAANDYVETLSVRSKGSYRERLKQAREDNTAVSGIGPAWLRKVGKRPHITWEPIPERVKLIREMFELTIAGQAPWAIARTFNERGELSFTGRAWERTSIVKILRNRAIEGDYVVGEGKNQKPTGEVLTGYYPAIMPLDVIDQARAMLDRRRRGSGRNSGAVNNLFGQKVRCQECNGRMMLSGYQSRYLVCYDAMRGNGCTHRTSYKYRPFERAALDEILHLALDETFFRQAQKSNHLTLEIADVERAIRNRRAEVERLTDTLTRIASPTIEGKISKIEIEIAELGDKLAKLNDDLSRAQGAATAEAHLERVFAVRDALSHPQDDVRLPARLRVSEALQAVVDRVECGMDGFGEKRFLLHLAGGIHRAAFDNDGATLWHVLPNVEATSDEMIEGFQIASPSRKAKVDEYFRRRAAKR